MADADALGLPRDERQKGFGGRHMGILRQRVMFDRPDPIQPHFLGIKRLIDRFVKCPLLGFARRIDHLGFEADREFHGTLLGHGSAALLYLYHAITLCQAQVGAMREKVMARGHDLWNKNVGIAG